MPIVSLDTTTSFTVRPPTTTKQPLWNGRAVESLTTDSSCLIQKELHFSDYIAPETAPTTTHFENVEVLFFEWKPDESDDLLYFTCSPQDSDRSQESEWRFADRAPYIPKNDKENLTVEELLERTGYMFATDQDLQIIPCKKVKDRVVGWWKDGIKWAKKHKKVLIVTGVVLGTGAFVAGVVLLASAATEAAVATTAAVGAAVAGGSGTKKKEEEEKPPAPQETASEPPPPPPFIPSIDFSPPTEKPQPPKETASASPPSRPAELPSIGFQPPTNGKSQSSKGLTSVPTFFAAPIDFTNPQLYHEQIQGHAKTYFNYLKEHASNPSTPIPQLPTPSSPMENPQRHLFSSIFQIILKGFSFIGTNLIDNFDLLQPNSPNDPFHNAYEDLMKEHNISAYNSSQALSMPAIWGIAPLKSVYYDYLNLLASYNTDYLQRPLPKQPPCSTYYTIEGVKTKSTQVTHINGMDTIYLGALANANYLRSMTTLQVEGIYNRTNGKIADLLEITALNLAGYSPITEELIMKKFIDFAEANKDDPHARCFHTCHSQSALHTLNALEKLPEEVRKRVIVVNIAGARVIPKRLCFQSFNYVSERDIVPDLQYLYKSLLIANLSDEERQEILNQEILDAQEIIVLKSEKNATGFEHSFQDPIYAEVLREHLEEYQERQGQY